MEFERQSQELFEVLTMITEGEAKLMARNVLMQDGIVAWQRWYRHHNWRTMARVLRMHKEAMHPKPVKDIGQLISSIVAWEDKWGRMANEHTTDWSSSSCARQKSGHVLPDG